MMVIGQGKMNLDASCVSRRPPQRRKRCLLALLHSEAGDLEALGMDVLHAKMLRVRPDAAEKGVRQARSVEKGAAGKGLDRHTLPEYGLPGRSRAGGHFTGWP